MVDKNLFLYDLAVVAIMKNEAPYVKEWLDYHLVAGVDHFYIYDNESPDNLKEVLQPYIDAGIVTYTFYPGKLCQMKAYLDSIKRFKYFCRYMAWIDGDEFIFPKSKPVITEIVDEVLSASPASASGLGVNWNVYGSNNLEKADFSRGVLERFTRRAETQWAPPLGWSPARGGNATVKTIANPRRIKFFPTPHAPEYFSNCFAVNENAKRVQAYANYPVTSEKIVVNHYYSKSLEEFKLKNLRGRADVHKNSYDKTRFDENDRNEVFDDGIIKYYDTRLDDVLQAGSMEDFISSKKLNTRRALQALQENLNSILNKKNTLDFFKGKIEHFLICLKLVGYFKGSLLSDEKVQISEEISLNGVYFALIKKSELFDLELLLNEMPALLAKPYPIVEKIHKALLAIIPQILKVFHMNNAWKKFSDMDHELEMLESFYTVMNK